MGDLHYNIATLMNQAQLSSASHPKCISQMRKLFESNEFTDFWEAFKNAINRILPLKSKQKHLPGERCIEFISSFVTSTEQRSSVDDESFTESLLLLETFNYLLKTQQDINEDVRFWSCQIINKLLCNLVGNDLSVALCDNIQEAMLKRAVDPKARIRIQAVMTMCPLQDPMNINCPIVEVYLHLMNNDSNPIVRKLCVEKVAIRRDVVPKIFHRTLDVNVKVRLAAYNRALKSPQLFKIVEKHKLLKNGLHDKHDHVKNFIQQHLVLIWFEYYNENYIDLMKSLWLDSDWKDLKETVTIIEYVMDALISIRPLKELLEVLRLKEDKLVPVEDLNWQIVLYWRILLQHLQKLDDIEVSSYIPEIIHLCNLVSSYNNFKKDQKLNDTEYLEYQFILNQMFVIMNSYDLSEPECRKHINNLLTETIKGSTLDTEVVDVMITTFDFTLCNNDEKIRTVCELVSEIMYSCDGEVKPNEDNGFEVAQLKVQLNGLKGDMDTCIREHLFLKADDIQTKIAVVEAELQNLHDIQKSIACEQPKINTDVRTIFKYLDVCNSLLSSPKVTVLNSVLRTLKQEVIQDLLIHDNETIRYKAFKCYALLCILDYDSAKVGIHMFCAPIYIYNSGADCDVPTLLVAISAVVDFIMLFGTDLLATPKTTENNPSDSFDEQHESIFKGGSSLSGVIQGLLELMQDENPEIQEGACHGLCNLLLAGRVQSPAIISRLVIKWASPATDDESSIKLRQLIGLALEHLPMLPDTSDQIEKAVLRTLKTIIKAPKKSPLADINVDNIAKFMVALCKSCPDADVIQMNLVRSICTEIRDNPRKKTNAVFSKMLLNLSLQEDNTCSLKEFLILCDQIRDEVHDRHVLSNIIKFNAILTHATNKMISVIMEENEPENETVTKSVIEETQLETLSNKSLSSEETTETQNSSFHSVHEA